MALYRLERLRAMVHESPMPGQEVLFTTLPTGHREARNRIKIEIQRHSNPRFGYVDIYQSETGPFE